MCDAPSWSRVVARRVQRVTTWCRDVAIPIEEAYSERRPPLGVIGAVWSISIALNWEKAFDRVSWDYYHQAIGALGFGPNFASWAKMLANPDLPPTRRVKIAGQYSNPFTIKCGVPQGCPFSPLAFLV
eukprot:scaffold6704_cov137-Isochrysis_galbana.AAC.9